MKGKIGQSMSLGLPVVTTSIGAEGMDLENGGTRCSPISTGLRAAVIRLYRDEALCGRCPAKRSIMSPAVPVAVCADGLAESFCSPE